MNGIYGKFYVRKIVDHAGKHDGCRYFVLDPRHDPIARVALAAYAQKALDEGGAELAGDLTEWLVALGAEQDCDGSVTCPAELDTHDESCNALAAFLAE